MQISHQAIYRGLGLAASGDLGPFTFYTGKRHQLIWFPKAPPTSPPTALQTHQRNLFRITALSWKLLPRYEKWCWSQAARRARLRITGYNLFVHYVTRSAHRTIAVIERQSGLKLLPLHHSAGPP
jgi:hypothetical protein